MRKILAIIICKLLKIIGGFLGKGSSLPGKYALKICPDILRQIKLPKYVIAVTGSNGKTSTVEMLTHILRSQGKRVAVNKEGSNQIEGVTTLILGDCTLLGRVKSEILLIESDERFAKYTFKYFAPTHYVITNLYRDQLTRNGHPDWVYNAIKQSIHDETQLILNADDPLVSRFSDNRDNTVWFGVGPLDSDQTENTSVYNDMVYCPVCHSKHFSYMRYHYNHIGLYSCPDCGFCRQATDYTVSCANLEKGELNINGEYKISLAFKSIYNIYNILAAFSVIGVLGLDKKAAAESISNYVLKNGRVVTFKLGERCGTLLTSKHENSISYNQSIKYCCDDKEGCDVVIIVDAVSRKYFTSDVSWLWDIDFERLENENIKNIILAGKYSGDLAVRFSYTDIRNEKITIIPDINKAVDYLKGGEGKIYIITCFSDKDKLLERVEL